MRVVALIGFWCWTRERWQSLTPPTISSHKEEPFTRWPRTPGWSEAGGASSCPAPPLTPLGAPRRGLAELRREGQIENGECYFLSGVVDEIHTSALRHNCVYACGIEHYICAESRRLPRRVSAGCSNRHAGTERVVPLACRFETLGLIKKQVRNLRFNGMFLTPSKFHASSRMCCMLILESSF